MSTKKITRIALTSAILFMSQIALAGVPNCEIVSLLVVIFTLSLGKEMILSVWIFALLEMVAWGMGSWVIMYFYLWPLLVLICLGLKKFHLDRAGWTIVLAFWGLIFGALCALVYIPVSPSYALNYWIAGIPWDIRHCVCNAILCFILYKPLQHIMKEINKKFISND